MADDLPDDILADLLGRLSPRDQASSHCVCKAWRGVIDARRLLRADLLPLTLRGIFLAEGDHDHGFPPLFSRPSTGPAICDNLDDCFAANDMKDLLFYDHCNGLLLFSELVVNPATGRWARFPAPPPSPLPLLVDEQAHGNIEYDKFLAFDPTASPYYEIFLVPWVPIPPSLKLINPDSEWPPSPFVLRVFSSRTGQWDDRLFEPEPHGLPTMGTVAGIREYYEQHVFNAPFGDYSAFYRGRLYVQCQKGFVMRINTSSGTHQLLKRPMSFDASNIAQFYLGKSKHWVYYAAVSCGYTCRLQVWYLDESHTQLKWVFKCDTCISSALPLPPRRSYRAFDNNNNGPWFLRCYGDHNCTRLAEEEIAAPKSLEWSSDMEDIPSVDGPASNHRFHSILGFHPYKEIVFLHQSNHRGIAYHLNSSKIQDLGSLGYRCSTGPIYQSFPYTPC